MPVSYINLSDDSYFVDATLGYVLSIRMRRLYDNSLAFMISLYFLEECFSVAPVRSLG